METRRSERLKNAQPLRLSPRLVSLFHEPNPELGRFKRQTRLLHSDPNVFLVHNFLTESELQHFDRAISQNLRKFKNSYTDSSESGQVYSEQRTSRFLHLGKFQDSTVRGVERRVADLFAQDVFCVEPLQIVHYSNGQKFDLHHDAGTLCEEEEVQLVPPVRLVTVFVYLNSLPAEQGCTVFPKLNLRVQPARGSALLFCNLLPDGSADPRTVHSASPVCSPWQKYGVNIWVCRDPLFDPNSCAGHVRISNKRTDTEPQSVLDRLEEEYLKTIQEEDEEKR